MGVRQMIKYNYDPNLATAYTIMAQTNGDSAKHYNQLLRGAARGQRQSINALGKSASTAGRSSPTGGTTGTAWAHLISPPTRRATAPTSSLTASSPNTKGRAAAHSGGTRSMDWIDPRPPSMPSSPTHTWTAPSNACWPSGRGHFPSTVGLQEVPLLPRPAPGERLHLGPLGAAWRMPRDARRPPQPRQSVPS